MLTEFPAEFCVTDVLLRCYFLDDKFSVKSAMKLMTDDCSLVLALDSTFTLLNPTFSHSKPTQPKRHRVQSGSIEAAIASRPSSPRREPKPPFDHASEPGLEKRFETEGKNPDAIARYFGLLPLVG